MRLSPWFHIAGTVVQRSWEWSWFLLLWHASAILVSSQTRIMPSMLCCMPMME